MTPWSKYESKLCIYLCVCGTLFLSSFQNTLYILKIHVLFSLQVGLGLLGLLFLFVRAYLYVIVTKSSYVCRNTYLDYLYLFCL